jgi:predicted DNA-binding protein
MTLTIKLEPDLEKALATRSAALKQPKSALVRDALRAYLHESASPFELGRDLFARHDGPADLATNRKKYLSEVLNEKQVVKRNEKRRG